MRGGGGGGGGGGYFKWCFILAMARSVAIFGDILEKNMKSGWKFIFLEGVCWYELRVFLRCLFCEASYKKN